MILLTARLYLLFIIAGIWIDQRKNSNPSLFWRTTGYLYTVIFIIEDFIFDVTIGSLWFMSFPEFRQRDVTFTARLKLMKKTEYPWSWRYKLAFKFCELLNKVDKDHC